MSFELPEKMLDEIQLNIENIINNFDIPEDNKLDVIKQINFIYSGVKQISITDALTGLYNRRHFESNFEREFERAKRYGSKLTIAIIDIDHFKQINDTYGHTTGDFVLKETGFLALNSIRTTDMLFRYGGEEFVAILTETDANSALIPLERLRATVEHHRFVYKGEEIKVTVSIGLTSDTTPQSAKDMFELADKALYRAKDAGRNNIKM
jgi:two-component system cell cycle response regulator